MENLLKVEMCLKTLKEYGPHVSSYISSGQSYDTDQGVIFVKSHPKPEVCINVISSYNYNSVVLQLG